MKLEAKFRKALHRLMPTRSPRAGATVHSSGAGATIIVGMHRSGTSFLTGSLQQAGLDLGLSSSSNPHNPRGNRENREIRNLHDAILKSRGFAWDNPPSNGIRWTEQECARAQSIVDGFRGAPHWGFKDPRALLLIEGWEALLPKPGFVGVFRHPAAVARSLGARSDMPRHQGLDLWHVYNTRLLGLHQRSPFPLLNFDDPSDLLLAKVDQVAASIGLHIRGKNSFYSDELRHHHVDDADLPEAVAVTLRSLRQLAL